MYAHSIRLITLLVGAYVMAATHVVIGIFIIVSGLFSFVFMLRRGLGIPQGTLADTWEFFGTLLVLANSLVLGFGDYYDPRYAWLDVPMHMAGGAFGGFWAYLMTAKEIGHLGSVKVLLLLLGITGLVGIGWECFEWLADYTIVPWYSLPPAQPTVNDTMGDLLFDMIGGLGAILFLLRRKG